MANLRLYCFPICAFTPTGGGANIDILLATTPSGSWDDYHGGGSESSDHIGVIFPPALVDELDFTEGDAYGDGGWFTAEPTVESFDGSTWTAVSGQVCAPAYDNSGGTAFESYVFTFTPVQCKGLRLRGTPGGSAFFITAQALAPIGALVGDLRAGAGVTRIQAYTPTGGGQPVSAINDGLASDWGNTSTALSWDSYHGGGVSTDDWVGYTYSQSYLWSGMLFVSGGLYTDGGAFLTAPTIEVRVSGVWTAVSSLALLTDAGRGKGVGGAPSSTYVATTAPNSTRDLYSFTPIAGDGIRIRGAPIVTAYFISSEEIVPIGSSVAGFTPANSQFFAAASG